MHTYSVIVWTIYDEVVETWFSSEEKAEAYARKQESNGNSARIIIDPIE